MPLTEADRRQLYADLERALGPASAEIMMAHLTPVEVLATKADLERLESKMATKEDLERFATKEDLKALETRMHVDLDRLYGMMKSYYLGTLGGFFALLAAIIGTSFFG